MLYQKLYLILTFFFIMIPLKFTCSIEFHTFLNIFKQKNLFANDLKSLFFYIVVKQLNLFINVLKSILLQ